MPSSISSFETSQLRLQGQRRIAFLVISLALLGVVTEMAGSWGLSRISRIQRRIDWEAADAERLTKTGMNGRPTLLLLGNSLIEEGVDFPKLKGAISSKYDAHRYVIEQTAYLDWYFALKHLFRHGARPSVVALSLSVGQFLSDGSRGEFMAHAALDVQDLPELARREHLDSSTTSDMLFAHYSGWLGARADIRKWLMAKLMPRAADLANVLGFQKAPVFTPELLMEKKSRLQDLKAACDANGARLILVIPPVTAEDGSTLLSKMGAQLGITVLTPVQPGEYSKEFFRDGFHLTAKSAELFTPRLAEAFSQ